MKKPKYELTQACKKIWEKLRIHKNENSKEKNHELIDELLKLIKEKDMNVSLIYVRNCLFVVYL